MWRPRNSTLKAFIVNASLCSLALFLYLDQPLLELPQPTNLHNDAFPTPDLAKYPNIFSYVPSLCEKAINHSKSKWETMEPWPIETCGVHGFYGLTHQALAIDDLKNHSFYVNAQNEVKIWVCGSQTEGFTFSNVYFQSRLVGQDIIPLQISPQTYSITHYDTVLYYLLATFNPRVAGQYIIDSNIMFIQNPDLSYFNGTSYPIGTYLGGHRFEQNYDACHKETRLYGSRQSITVTAPSNITLSLSNLPFCSDHSIFRGHWRTTSSGEQTCRNHTENNCLGNPLVLNDDDGVGVNWFWSPHSCTINYNLKELMLSFKQKHMGPNQEKIKVLFCGDSLMQNLHDAIWKQSQVEGSQNMLHTNWLAHFYTKDQELIDMVRKTYQTLYNDKFDILIANFGLTHQVYRRQDFLLQLQKIVAVIMAIHENPEANGVSGEAFQNHKPKILFLSQLAFSNLKEYSITPRRESAMNAVSKNLLEPLGYTYIDGHALTETRWEASRDGLHYFGYCRNNTYHGDIAQTIPPHYLLPSQRRSFPEPVNECGNTIKALVYAVFQLAWKTERGK